MNILAKVGSILGGGAVITVLASGVSQDSTVSHATVSTAQKQQEATSNPITGTIIPQNESAATNKESAASSIPVVPKTSKETPINGKPTSSCHPSYSGCLKINAGDYDCASGSGNGPNYTGPVEVYGSDPFDLDRDNDGWGCDR